jgi:hypothetical protein
MKKIYMLGKFYINYFLYNLSKIAIRFGILGGGGGEKTSTIRKFPRILGIYTHNQLGLGLGLGFCEENVVLM